MKTCFFALLLLISPVLTPLTAWTLSHDSFRIDPQGNITTVSNGSLDYFDAQGKLIVHHSESLLSAITSIDRNSALRVLAFYAAVPAFQILDNTLSPHSELYDLTKAGMENTAAVCMSANNTYWAYDAVTFELVRFDLNFNILSRGTSTALTVGAVLEPERMLEYNGRLYIADARQGVFTFDQFGTFDAHMAYTDLVDIDVEKGYIYVLRTEGLERIAISSGLLEQSNQPISGQITMDVNNDTFYCGDGKVVYGYALHSLFD
jgi:hypothetical protein